jgi:HEPN domain-containing protein
MDDLSEEYGKNHVKKRLAEREINPKPTKAEELGLEELTKLILKLFPSVQMIIQLGTHPTPFTYYLLILTGYDEKISDTEVSNKIEDNCKYLANVYALVHKAGSAQAGVTAGQRFWVKARHKGIVAYQATDFELPEHEVITHEVLMERAKLPWERWGVQGKEFFSGAEIYRSEDNFRLAAFLLHQSVDGTLKALIQAILGYRVQMHNLSRLLRITLLFTDDLKSVFNLDTTEGEQLFTLLQSSYSQSRYSNEFNPDGKSVLALSKTVKKMITMVEMIYLQYAGKKDKND